MVDATPFDDVTTVPIVALATGLSLAQPEAKVTDTGVVDGTPLISTETVVVAYGSSDAPEARLVLRLLSVTVDEPTVKLAEPV